jgi:hypothetical protein
MSGGADLLATLRASGGQSAPAQITKTKRGRAVRGDPSQISWKVTLLVRPEHHAPFNVVVQVPYPKSEGGPSSGSVIGVVYDPKDHSKIALDPSAPVESFGQAQAATMNRVVGQAMRGSGLVIAGGQVISGGQAPGAPSPAAGGGSVADELERLSSLRDKGTITEAEFEAQKQRLLGA